MKKISLIFVILILAIYSCNKEEIGRTENRIELTPYEIGQYHNIAVDLYLKSKINKPNKKSNIIEIKESIISLMSKNYPELMKNYSTPKDGNFINPKYIIKGKNNNFFDFNSFVIDGLNSLVRENKISYTFADNIKYITLSGLTYEEVKTEINTLRRNNLSENEIYFLDVFENILNASYVFWNSYWNFTSNRSKSNENIARLPCSSRVIIGDAVGGALGSFASPLWGYIQGAAVSAALNEDCY